MQHAPLALRNWPDQILLPPSTAWWGPAVELQQGVDFRASQAPKSTPCCCDPVLIHIGARRRPGDPEDAWTAQEGCVS